MTPTLRLRTLAAIAALAAGVGCAAEPRPVCMENLTCDQCVRAAGCGWCASAARCVPGLATGPMDMAACPAELFRFGTAARVCDDPCATNRTCRDCAVRVGCGWCTDGQRCMAGTAASAAAGGCVPPNWRFTPSNCP